MYIYGSYRKIKIGVSLFWITLYVRTGVLSPGAVQLTVVNGPPRSRSVLPRHADHRPLPVTPLHVGDAAPVRLRLKPVPHQHSILSRRASLVARQRRRLDWHLPVGPCRPGTRRPRDVAAGLLGRRSPVLAAFRARVARHVALQSRVVADVIARQPRSRL